MSFVTFGEIMLRLTPKGKGDKLILANQFSVAYAGAESNVATSLACLENHVDFVSKVPDNPLGKAALLGLEKFGVNTKNSLIGGDRMGTYFIELGSSIRPSRVIYDRKGSAISTITKEEFDWETILKDRKWLHLSGITPALSNQCANETILAAKTAKELGVTVSFDMNYRRSLWPNGKKARRIFDTIIEYSDIIFGNLGVLADVYDFSFSGASSTEQTEKALQKAETIFGVENIAFTIREHQSASQNKLQGMSLNYGQINTSKAYELQVEDRFGTGDAFAAAYLHAVNKNWDAQKTVAFATAAFALKHTLRGDIHTSSEKEILTTMDGDLSGYVIR